MLWVQGRQQYDTTNTVCGRGACTASMRHSDKSCASCIEQFWALLLKPTDAAAEPPDDGSLAVTPLAKMGVHSDLSCTGSGMAT